MDIEQPDGATPLEPEELEGLRFKHIATRGELDHLEQANIAEGLRWMRRSRRSDIFSIAYACELHRRLFGQVWHWAGEFRKTGKNIGVDAREIPVSLRLLFDDAKYWLDTGTYAPREAALRFHHRLVFIHPFINGNGRHARILADASLEKLCGQGPIDWSGGYNLQGMNKRRSEYIQALRAADRGDYSLLLAFGRVC